MPKIILPQKKLTLEVALESNLMDALLAAQIPVASSCHGEGVCSMCRVTIQGQVNAPEEFEVAALKRNKCAPEERMSCQILVTEDLIVSTKYW